MRCTVTQGSARQWFFIEFSFCRLPAPFRRFLVLFLCSAWLRRFYVSLKVSLKVYTLTALHCAVSLCGRCQPLQLPVEVKLERNLTLHLGALPVRVGAGALCVERPPTPASPNASASPRTTPNENGAGCVVGYGDCAVLRGGTLTSRHGGRRQRRRSSMDAAAGEAQSGWSFH